MLRTAGSTARIASTFTILGVEISRSHSRRGFERFYEKVVKVKVDVAALLTSCAPHFHRKFCVRIAQEQRLATRSTLSIPPFVCLPVQPCLFSSVLYGPGGDSRGCQGRHEGAFILTLDNPASHFIFELGKKRNAVQWFS